MKSGSDLFVNQMEKYFKKFRDGIIGIDQTFQSPYGEKKIVYADWIASGRLYRPIEEKITNQFGQVFQRANKCFFIGYISNLNISPKSHLHIFVKKLIFWF